MREFLFTAAILVFAFLTFAGIIKTCCESDKKKALKKFLYNSNLVQHILIHTDRIWNSGTV